MKLFKRHSIASWLILVAVTVLLICNTFVQTLFMDVGIVATLAKIFLPLVLTVGTLHLLKETRVAHLLQENPIRVVAACFCSIIWVMLMLNTEEIILSLYPLYTICAIVVFSVTAQMVKKHVFSGCWILWLELAILCLLAGLTEDFEAVFAVAIIGAVIGIALCLRSDKSVFTKIAYTLFFCVFITSCISMTVLVSEELIIDFIVDHLYPDYWHIDGALPSLEQFQFVGQSKTTDPLHNVLAVTAGNLGSITLIAFSILMLLVIVCSFLLLKEKNGVGFYLHLGATVAVILSFVGNVLYVCGLGNLVAKNAAFFNMNFHYLIGEALLLIIILRQEPFLIHRQKNTAVAREFDSSDSEAERAYDFTLFPVSIPSCREAIVGLFRTEDYATVLKDGDIAVALEGKKQGTICKYEGECCYVEDVFRNLTLTGDRCAVKMYTGVNASTEELAELACEILSHLPKETAFSVVTDTYEEDECLIFILTV